MAGQLGSGVKSILRNAGYLFGHQGVTSVVQLVYMMVLAHQLGPRSFGVLRYAFSWHVTLLSLTGLGLGVILAREIGEDRRRASVVLPQTLALRAVASLVAAGVAVAVGVLFEHEEQTRHAVVIFGLAVVARALVNWSDKAFSAFESSRYTLLLGAVFRPAEAAVGIALATMGFGAREIALAYAVSSALHALVGCAKVRRLAPGPFTWRRDGVAKVLRQGLPVGVGRVLAAWSGSGPVVMMRQLAGTGDRLGQLAFAMQANSLLRTVLSAVRGPMLPVLRRAVVRGDDKTALVPDGGVRIALVFGTALYLGADALGPPLVELVLGPRFAHGGALLGLASLVIVPWIAAMALTLSLLARGHFVLPAVAHGAGALVLSAAAWPLYAGWEARGVLAATVLGMTARVAVLWPAVARAERVRLWPAVIRAGLAAGVGIAAYFALGSCGARVALLAALVALGGATLALGVVTPEERRWLKALLRR